VKGSTWLLLGAAGVGAWWFLRKKNGNGADACAQALAAMPAEQRPPPGMVPNFDALYLKHCRAASAEQRACFMPSDYAAMPSPECQAATLPMLMEAMPGMMPGMDPAGDPGIDPWPPSGTETGGGTPGPQLTTSQAPQIPTPEGMGYAGGIYARHLFAGMT